MLYPQQNMFRSVFDMSGFWKFKPDPQRAGHRERWYENPFGSDAMTIAVPGAWNEQLAERGVMNYVGPGWYETEIILSSQILADRRIWLRIGAADHKAEVWLNGTLVGSHEGGYLPFEIQLTDCWKSDGSNRLTICVDSTLTMHTIPQDVDPTEPPYNDDSYDRRHLYPPTRFDFFPYGGLTRSVVITTTPRSYLTEISIQTRLDGSVSVRPALVGECKRWKVRILDREKKEIASARSEHAGSVSLHLANVIPWSPMDPYLYCAEVRLMDAEGHEVDGYDEEFGVREIRIDRGTLLLNGKPLFLVGFGKHEDLPIVGRGQFRAAYLRDFELMRWVGANSFRTSHYPYDEEVMRLADRLGFLVIDEVPAVSLGFWSDRLEDLRPLLENHKKAITELIERDANHPSVIAWSIANEPNLWSEEHYQNEASRKYFREVYDHTKQADATRPVMAITIPAFSENDVALEACDLIGINRYFAWYTEPVALETAAEKLDAELERIFKKHGKPIVLTEFGVDTIEGYHATTPQFFTEEYQTVFLLKYSAIVESKPFCAGAHIWNFSDFLTPQHFRRVVLNKKGVFTRSRQPKGAAFAVRDHWFALDRVAREHRPAPPDEGFLVQDIGREQKNDD